MILQMDRGEIASTNRQWGRDSDLMRVFANIRQRLLPKNSPNRLVERHDQF
jgi:hypothetical protein